MFFCIDKFKIQWNLEAGEEERGGGREGLTSQWSGVEEEGAGWWPRLVKFAKEATEDGVVNEDGC